MRVRITKARNKESWYSDYIGLIVDVMDDSGPNLWKTQSGNFILKEDAEVVSNQVPSEEKPRENTDTVKTQKEEIKEMIDTLKPGTEVYIADISGGGWRAMFVIQPDEKPIDKARRLRKTCGPFTVEAITAFDAYEDAVREAGRWTDELIEKYIEYLDSVKQTPQTPKAPSYWLREREAGK